MPNGVMQLAGIECRYMVAESLRIQKGLAYVDVFGLLPLLQRLCFSPETNSWDPPNVLITGPKGTGKTLLFMAVAEQGGIPYLSVDCSEETRERHLKGGFVAKSGETPYVFGAITNAIQVANETGAAILVFEEMNALSPQMQKLINPLTDFRKKIELPELSSTVALLPTARIWVVGTMNPSAYGTTYEINDDLKSRFIEIQMPYPPPAAEKRILRATAPPMLELSDDTLNQLVNIANESRQGAMGYEVSTRDLVQALTTLPRIGWENALFFLAQKFSDEDRMLFLQRVGDITRISIPQDISFWSGTRTR